MGEDKRDTSPGHPPWRYVTREQVRGVDLRCVNCEHAMGGTHALLCHGMAKAKRRAQYNGGTAS